MGPNFAVDSSGTLHASGAVFQGTITASAGLIGGFTTDDHKFAGSNFFISGSATGDQRFISTTNFNVKASGDITGSQVLFTGGKIGGFNFGTNTFTATNFKLNPSGKRITLGSSNSIFIADGDEGIQLGHATFGSAPFSVTTAGVLKAESGTIGGFTLSTNTLTATNFTLDPSGKRITLGTGNTIFIADGDEGIQLGHATFNSAPFSVTNAGVLKAESGTIGGFTLSSNACLLYTSPSPRD